MSETFRKGDALLIVDVQNDFMPGGALAVPEGDKIIPVVNRLIQKAREANIPIYASRDWHPANHISFESEGGPWPPHCVRDTRGAAFHPEIDFKEDVVVLSKGTKPDREAYSAFDGTNLTESLRTAGVNRVFVGGLAQDYCVRASVIDAASEGFDVHLVLPATRAIGDDSGNKALVDMKKAGATVEEEAPL